MLPQYCGSLDCIAPHVRCHFTALPTSPPLALYNSTIIHVHATCQFTDQFHLHVQCHANIVQCSIPNCKITSSWPRILTYHEYVYVPTAIHYDIEVNNWSFWKGSYVYWLEHDLDPSIPVNIDTLLSFERQMPRTNSSLPYFTRRSRQSQSIRLHRSIFCFPNLEETFSDSFPNTHDLWHHGYWLLGIRQINPARNLQRSEVPYRIVSIFNIRFFFIFCCLLFFLLLAFSRISFNMSWDSDSHVGWDFIGFRTCIIHSSHSYVPVGGRNPTTLRARANWWAWHHCDVFSLSTTHL